MLKKTNLLVLAVMPIVLSLGLAATAVPAVWAQGAPSGSVLDDMSKSATNTGGSSGAGLTQQEQGLGFIIGRIIKGFLGLLGTVFVVLVIYAGYLWMTASGNEEQITKAKKLITNAVIGIIIISLAYVITSFVMTNIQTASTATDAAPPASN